MDIDFLISMKNNCKMVKMQRNLKNMCNSKTRTEMRNLYYFLKKKFIARVY